jgi:hypothetical protein
MQRQKSAGAEADSIKGILPCVVFVALNILDAWLTGVALGSGSQELNPFMGMTTGSNMLTKGLISAGMVIVLLLLKQGKLLKLLSLVMLVICVWNGVAILSWS